MSIWFYNYYKKERQGQGMSAAVCKETSWLVSWAYLFFETDQGAWSFAWVCIKNFYGTRLSESFNRNEHVWENFKKDLTDSDWGNGDKDLLSDQVLYSEITISLFLRETQHFIQAFISLILSRFVTMFSSPTTTSPSETVTSHHVHVI